jgi:hypothetical protein
MEAFAAFRNGPERGRLARELGAFLRADEPSALLSRRFKIKPPS